MIDREALARLHDERFAELPLDCGRELDAGIADEDKWRDWSAMPTTPDQARIESYIDRFDLRGRAILHVGSGNSLLAARFARRASRIVGTTVVEGEARCGEELAAKAKLRNYRVLMHNKYAGAGVLAGERFDFIVDNNPSTFCCCLTHFARMIEFYAGALSSNGQIVTDRVGLGWTSDNVNPRWRFTAQDLAAVAQLAGLTLYPTGDLTLVLSAGPPRRPTLASLLSRQLRRIGRRLSGAGRRLLGS